MIFASWGLGHITTFTFTSRCPREIRVQAIVVELVIDILTPAQMAGRQRLRTEFILLIIALVLPVLVDTRLARLAEEVVEAREEG